MVIWALKSACHLASADMKKIDDLMARNSVHYLSEFTTVERRYNTVQYCKISHK